MLQSYSNFAISFDPSLKIQASNKIHLSNSISRSFKFTQIFDLGASQLNKLSLPLYDSQKHPLLAKPSRSIFSPFDTVVPRPFPPHPPFDPPSSSSWISEGSHRFLLLLLAIVRANNETMKKIPVPRPTFLSTSLLYGVSFSIQSYAVSTSSYRVVRDGLP